VDQANTLLAERCYGFAHLHFVDVLLDLARDGHKLMKEFEFEHIEGLTFTEGAPVTIASGLQALKGHVQLTREPCCVTLEEDEDQWRAKLACGHVISMYTLHLSHRSQSCDINRC